MKKILFLLLLNITIGCANPVHKNDVIGQYEAVYKRGVEILQVNSDMTYHYSFKSSENSLVQEGKWEFEIENGRATLIFHDFIFAHYSFERKGMWIVDVSRNMGGRVRLIVNPDLRYEFKKTPS